MSSTPTDDAATAGLLDDLTVLRTWWDTVCADAPTDAAGLWFGLADLLGEDGAARHVYAAACPSFDATDTSAEWACEYTWGPTAPVLVPGIARVPEGAHELVLERAATLVRLLEPRRQVPALGVAVGFDDGDFLLVDTGP